MFQKRYDYDTIKGIALYMIEHGSTLRQVAKIFNIPKSTIHSQLLKKLQYDDYETFAQVRELLDKNKAERAIRGGEATRKKYISMKH